MRDVRGGMSPDEASKKHGVKANTIRTWKRRDKGGAEAAPAAQEPAETASFAMDSAQLPADQMPDFGPATSPTEAPSAAPAGAAAGSSTAPAPTPSPADAIVWAKLVSLASDGFQAVVVGQIQKSDGSKPASPQPPEPISKEDQKELADALHAAFVAYGGNLAEFLAKWGPLINLTVVTGAIFLPRIMQARDYIKHQNAVKKAEAEARAKIANGSNGVASPLAQAIRTEDPETSLGDQLARRHAGVVTA